MTSVFVLQPSISEIEEETMMKLSPYAPEFFPSSTLKPDVDLCIFNDGVPSLVMSSHSTISELIDGIPDEALDEAFYPSAHEVTELEDMKDFVEMMAALSYMEECEERARTTFSHIKKRWESRRVEGLSGRPRPAKHLIKAALHGVTPSSRALVCYQNQANRIMHDQQMLHRDTDLRVKHRDIASRKQKHHYTIQQPRKLN